MTASRARRKPVPTTPERKVSGRIGALCLIVLAAAAASGWRHAQRTAAAPVLAQAPWQPFSQKSCAECHAEITDSFIHAPHANTLHRGSEPEILSRFAGRKHVDGKTGIEFHYENREGGLWLSTPSYGRDVPIDWIFGSGTHAQTPLITWTGAAGGTIPIEHRVSWYPGDRLERTLGSEDVPAHDAGISCLGRQYSPAEAATCFGCHSTQVPVTENLKIRFDALVPNIGCVRCHWQGAEHALGMKSGEAAGIEHLSQLPPLEAVNRCGECHRRANEQEPHLIDPEEKAIVRFAPVGLVQSPCFLRQQDVELDPGKPARLDCATCHNPHAPPQRDWQAYVAACLQCHDQARHRALDCPVAKRSDDCLPCHMPKVAMNPWLSFTDHWIRAQPNWKKNGD
jgi:hypothetical protein